MAQGMLPFKYETEKKTTGMTALGGLPAYLDLAQVIGLNKSIQKHLKVRSGCQGWTDAQMVLALVLLNLAGGDCVDDIKVLEADDGFCEVLKVEPKPRWIVSADRFVRIVALKIALIDHFSINQKEKDHPPGLNFLKTRNVASNGVL